MLGLDIGLFYCQFKASLVDYGMLSYKRDGDLFYKN